QAKQRASVLWLVSKAHNNRVPPELRDPFYRDHEDQERLKPQIGQGLASAELYCLALANIYADPNYHSLSHQGVVGALQRKGVDLEPPEDRTPLTETVLAQTAPLRMSAHMAVIGGIMDLYVKEVLIPIKVFEVVRRFAAVGYPEEVPVDAEDAALLWLNKCSVKMRHRIEDQLGTCRSEDGRHQGRPLVPHIPVVQDLGELSDGCALASLLSFYCPSFLPWEDLCLNEPMSLADSLYNLQLAQRFCDQHLPHDVCFLSVEDVLFVHPSVRQNLLALLADLMYLFEIRPAKCVRRPGLRHDQETPSPQHCLQGMGLSGIEQSFHSFCSLLSNAGGVLPVVAGGTSRGQRSLLARDERDSDPLSSSPKSSRSDEEEERAGRPSLRRRSSVGPEPLQPARLREAKERQNREPKHTERGEDAPSTKERPPELPPQEPGLRRSASRSELSSRGSPLRRNPSGTDLFRPSLSRSASQTDVRGSPPRRKTLESYYDQLGGAESLQRTAGYPLRKESSLSHVYNFSGEKAALEMSDPFETDMFAQQREKRTTSFAQLSRAKEEPGIHIVYSREAPRGAPERSEEGPLAARLGAVRLKLEERRSKIEREKRRLEERVKRQRQQAGQAAFLQAVGRAEARRAPSPPRETAPLGDAEADVDAVRRKWLGRNGSASDESSPRSEELDLEGCVSTVERLDSSLTDLEADIGRIERQQRAIRDLVHGAPPAPARFFLHEAQPESLPPPDPRAGDAAPPLSLPPQLAPAFQFQPARRQWGQFQPEQHWGPPVVALAEQPHSRPQWGPSVAPFGDYLLYPADSGTFQVRSPRPSSGQTSLKDDGEALPALGGGLPTSRFGFEAIIIVVRGKNNKDCVPSLRAFLVASLLDLSVGIVWDIEMQETLSAHSLPESRPWAIPTTRYFTHLGWTVSAERFFALSFLLAHNGQSLRIWRLCLRRPLSYAGVFVHWEAALCGTGEANRWRREMRGSGLAGIPAAPGVPAAERGRPAGPLPELPGGPVPVPAPPREGPRRAFGQTYRVSRPKGGEEAPRGEAGFFVCLDDQQPRKPKPRLRPRIAAQDPEAPRENPPDAYASASRARIWRDSRVCGAGTRKLREYGCHGPRNSSSLLEEGGKGLAGSGGAPFFCEGMLTVRLFTDPPLATSGTLHVAVKYSISWRKTRWIIFVAIKISPEQSRSLQSWCYVAGAEGSLEPKTGAAALGFVIGADLVNPDPEAETEMQRRKELIMMVSLRRREEQEASRLAKEQRNALKRMQEQLTREEQERKREEERQRRQQILEQYRQRKAREEAEGAEAGSSPRAGGTLTRPSKPRSSSRPRPKSSRRAPSPPCGDASWQRGGSDASETASAGSGSLQLLLPLGDYTGPKLFVKPAAKSNRGIVLNALNTVLAGQVNADTKRRVLEEMGVSDSKHFLILFRDAGCQFRGLYSYQPEREEVGRLFGVGPRTVTAPMMDLFFKYNSGAKSFSRIHTKHLTVTIDAFTIHNSLWAAKRAPRKDS
ncbi:conserved hypothetical protein, partial [Ixodes scapularis]